MTSLAGAIMNSPTKRYTACRFMALLALAVLAGPAKSENAVPSDVADYVMARDNCDSLRGEVSEPDLVEPEDISRMVGEINRYCKGTDRQLRQLKEKYAENAAILKALSGYEENIEADMSF
ncbi:hypothetical protein [Pseudomonas sp. Irchel s3f10]|uniref:hypothetical protein n=1 Tax=Pseudomonas sp. Irchel s3f10 TaxID=2009137 RepID=UPI002113F8DD|nr:hypothetical protein [Pseudomonas sp. Irchel s3f10]